ncbi:gamma-glutamyl-gamma-aminobutyrate hydrolase family protein [Mangrovicoccus algicola]|uniref:Gamma-glutamyl-gamma-aminobutyrate hydrolase family protein n=1 Tax=Mangrovicoccus algicola TaxID=2771008 RepID=A0A8J7CK76_9RHOB|nr:gamma-glutamyl-gamma-aminobutyrate hydrolase family protein [Mangrovicoccus algicola]MBE3638416.1 gamma-glutamyl-gamma-aminobutyrate hydrolase family protein [Mangrovicoccus algicola]
MTRPVIGVTVSRRSGWRIYPLVAFNIWLAGGRSQRWQAGRPADVDAVDGIVIGGGDDISPDFYGGEFVTSARLDPDRDRLERSLVAAAWAQNTPILGICRGAQMMNVALGGTLHQDAYKVYTTSRHVWTVLPRKTVQTAEQSRLARLMGRKGIRVNALHSQAVKDLGDGLVIAARDEGGMIQAVESIRDPFALGVQWHPEHLFYLRTQRRIFRALVTAARAYRQRNHQIGAVAEEAAADPLPG